jgi:hemoglobin
MHFGPPARGGIPAAAWRLHWPGWGVTPLHMTLARFPITPDQIDQVVRRFYAGVRAHPKLGPVFAAHVTDWPPHEEKISRFWRNAILFERSYDGNPMTVHKAAGNVRPGMFDDWLALFDATLTEVLPNETAQQWSALAHRIGRGLRYGLLETGAGHGQAPRF